ncbi:MAG: RCC1 domain-containing protein [Gemmatimonadales bacterium]
MITRRTLLAMISSAPLAIRSALHPPALRERRAICRGIFTFVLEPDGAVTMCVQPGLGYDGRHAGLGHTDPLLPNVAFDLPAVRGAADVASGIVTSFAVMPDGRILAWGINARGGLGITPLAEFEATGQVRKVPAAPTPVVGISDAVRVASSGDHTLAVTKAGAAYAWGYNIIGQLGIGPMPAFNYRHSEQVPYVVPFPIRVPRLSGVVDIAVGGSHSLALLEDGSVWAWGLNRQGQLGDGTTVDRNTPVAVTGVAGAAAVVAGSTISGALLRDGTVMAWGWGNGGLGRKLYTWDAPHPTPAPVAGVTGVRALACGESHMLAITTAGTVISWGNDLVGEVGHPGALPAQVPGLRGVRSVSADVARSVATLADGTIMAWGNVPTFAGPGQRSRRTTSVPRPFVMEGLKNPPA